MSQWPADGAPGLPLSELLSHPRAPVLGQSPGLREISGASSNCSFLEGGVSKDGCQATPGASIYSDDFSLFPFETSSRPLFSFPLGIGIVSVSIKDVLLWMMERRELANT